MLSLSYVDVAAQWLGPTGGAIPLFLSFMKAPFYSRDCVRVSLEIILNLCIHHDNRRLILENGGIEALVDLQGDDDQVVQSTAREVLGHLEDVTPPEVLARMKKNIGLPRMVQLSSDSDRLVRAVAAESIGEEVWEDERKKHEVVALGGVDALLAICSSPDETVETVLPSLWSLRNILHNNNEAQTSFGAHDGIKIIITVLNSCLLGKYHEDTGVILESCLSCLVNGISGHERNSRRLIMVGLQSMIDVADMNVNGVSGMEVDAYVMRAMQSEGIAAMAQAILEMLGPYNYVICRQCQKKQDINGTHCISCGYKLLLDGITSTKKPHPLTSISTVSNSSGLMGRSPTKDSLRRGYGSPSNTLDGGGSSMSKSLNRKKTDTLNIPHRSKGSVN
eukprot:CAMPEP_0182424646 /NCGR_PEP_ID=MMETSP1167-20130531/10876_1 /TAXON_ID=2988 /ORGANISM="Mallomonas Sp, Strain CCMP3275" /LENGTH=391 /DNA_ID=CAMNT_0024604619 /DNA_START=559 /DNA_END=1734 /DNA_ORIENTATION=-